MAITIFDRVSSAGRKDNEAITLSCTAFGSALFSAKIGLLAHMHEIILQVENPEEVDQLNELVCALNIILR